MCCVLVSACLIQSIIGLRTYASRPRAGMGTALIRCRSPKNAQLEQVIARGKERAVTSFVFGRDLSHLFLFVFWIPGCAPTPQAPHHARYKGVFDHPRPRSWVLDCFESESFRRAQATVTTTATGLRSCTGQTDMLRRRGTEVQMACSASLQRQVRPGMASTIHPLAVSSCTMTTPCTLALSCTGTLRECTCCFQLC